MNQNPNQTNNRAPTQQEILDVLVGIGKDMATRLLSEAISTAADESQLKNQLTIANVVGCHMLANLAFNAERRNGITATEWLRIQFNEIEKDVQELREAFAKGELELKMSPFEKN